MTGRSGKPSKKKTAAKVEARERAFAPAGLKQARVIAALYRLVIAPDDGGGFLGRTVEMPYVMADGETVEACARETMEATVGAVATLQEKGDPVPAAAGEGKRDQQVNVRLTLDEKERIDTAARRAGIRSVSDYIRNAALDRAG